MGNAEIPVGQEHAVFLGSGEMGQKFGMSGIMEPCLVDGLFVDGRGHDGADFSFHGQNHRFLNIFNGCFAGHGVNLAVFQL